MAGTQPLPGTYVAGTVVAHRRWGLEVILDEWAAATVDLRVIDDDVIVWGDPCRWPALGSRISGRIQGIMPNGQVRVTLRLSDQV